MALAIGQIGIEQGDPRLTSLVEQVAQTLHARVWAMNAQQVVVASSMWAAHSGSAAPGVTAMTPPSTHLTLPARLGRLGDLTLLVEPLSGEAIPPHLAQALVELLATQAELLDGLDGLPDRHQRKNQFVYRLLFEPPRDAESEALLVRQGQMLGIDLSLPRAAIVIDASDYLLPHEETREAQEGLAEQERALRLRLTNGGATDRMEASTDEAAGARLRHAQRSERSERDEAQMQRRAQRIIDAVVSFFHLPSDTICAYVGGGEVVVLKASGTRDLLAWADKRPEARAMSTRASSPAVPAGMEGAEDVDRLQPSQEPSSSSLRARASWADLSALKRAGAGLLSRIRRDTGASISIGIGRYHPGIGGLSRSYQDARAALLLGRHFQGANQLHCLDGLGIAAFVGIADDRTKLELAWHLLGPLDHEPELIETLQVFFAADCSASRAAERLALHRNTLTYRLEKVTQLTGLDPRHFEQAIQIRLALLLRSLQHQP